MDFTKPLITVVEKSTKGKTFFIYGTNRTGKTANAVKFPRPFALPFENGLNAIAGLPYEKPIKWADTRKITKQFARPEVKEMYDTILLDTADKMGQLLEKYICSVHGVDHIKDVDNGQGYLDITKYMGEFLDALTDEGYTVVILGHDTEKQVIDPQTGEKYMRVMPSGNKRVIAAICDLVDIIGYCQPNGFDENGDEVLSTIYLKDAKFFKAGSRWRHIVPSVTPFTVPNLTQALIDAIEAEENEQGGEFFVETKEKTEAPKHLDFDDLIAECKEKAKSLKKLSGNNDFFLKLVDDKIGEGAKLSETTRKQQEIVEEILDLMIEKIDELENGTVSLPN